METKFIAKECEYSILISEIRSLQNKISEVKKIVKNERPHLLGLSECELKRDSINIDSLKVPGHKLHFPKSWDLFGYARVVLYSNKSFDCLRISDLEDEHLQSIWVKFDFKNSKAGLYCQGTFIKFRKIYCIPN